MARRLTDTYFVRYSIKITGIRTNGVEKDVMIDGTGVFEIREYDSIIYGITNTLNKELQEAYPLYHIKPYVSKLSIKEITPL